MSPKLVIEIDQYSVYISEDLNSIELVSFTENKAEYHERKKYLLIRWLLSGKMNVLEGG